MNIPLFKIPQIWNSMQWLALLVEYAISVSIEQDYYGSERWEKNKTGLGQFQETKYQMKNV